ncbi:LysM domain-containing protein [Anaerobacterium chartisolvens]|uniref:LysM domain-containing protein n=1 Tax=Anaerobacterium chartisolvens TaxID=1297424 RepID=A0A369AYK2_9FIRM|nr:LysM peptidoglycan-binding domain-containing protein [Anaerobacterium chartisolvens]RCX13266.1 LysM domain-containing protein [Anaerobacterium chartisolvens]
MSSASDSSIKTVRGNIAIMLSFNNNAETLALPVVPDQLEVRTGLSNSTAEVVNLGEIGIIGNRKLKGITISSFCPSYYAPYCQCSSEEFTEPYVAVERISRWMDTKRPIRLKIMGMNINMACMIEEFSYREKGGQPGDVYYDLVLKEYRFIQAKIVESSASASGTSAMVRTVERQSPSVYTVKKGDSLWAIAKLQYGDGSRYKEIYEKNKKIIGPDPNLIKPGQELVL